MNDVPATYAPDLPAGSLADLEAIIERGLTTFVEVGLALMAIREGRLYRDTHVAFEDYCKERWGFSRQRAAQLIDAAEVSSMLDTPPDNARQATELARLKDNPDAVREVWSEVREAKGGKATTADVRDFTDRKLNVTRPTAPAPVRYAPSQDFGDAPEYDGHDEPAPDLGMLCGECRQPVPYDADECPTCAEATAAPTPQPVPLLSVPGEPDFSVPKAAPVVEAMAADLSEPPHEKAFYALSRMKLWLDIDPALVAETAHDPASDAPDYEALAAWVATVATGIRTRASGLRMVR